MYNELGEEEMNISYNALSELFGVDLIKQLASFSELLSPLKNRAKLYSNPLFLHDMMSNDKIKRWSQDMFRKTKAVASRLVTAATSSSDEEEDEKTKKLSKASSPIRGIMPPSEYLSDDDYAMDDPRVEKKDSLSLNDVAYVAPNRSRDSSPEEKPNFFSKLFKPKKKTEGQTPSQADSAASSYPDTLQFRFSSDSDGEEDFDRRSFDHYSYDEGMTQDLKPLLQRRSSEQSAVPRLHRAGRRVARPTAAPSSFDSEVEHSKCVWLNVNSQVASLSSF